MTLLQQFEASGEARGEARGEVRGRIQVILEVFLAKEITAERARAWIESGVQKGALTREAADEALKQIPS